MELQTKLVSVRKISSDVARSQLPVENIERAAQLIIAIEGVINPIILRRTSLESYEVVEGHLEYYAAVRAREINPRKGEMIQAIILELDNEEAILAQIKCLRSGFPSIDDKSEQSDDSSQAKIQNNLSLRLTNLEKSFQTQFDELRRDSWKLEGMIRELHKDLKGHSPSNHNLLVEQIVAEIKAIIKPPSPQKRTFEDLNQNPVNLNEASMLQLCEVPKIGQKTADKIITSRQTKGAFTSVDELSKRKLIAAGIIRNNQLDQCFTVR